jgi:integrase
MKNPNGYGSVVKLSGNRRNPYMARKTKGWNAKGHPQYKIIGYYPTKEAGLIALAQYNNAPWDVDQARTTFEELFELWKNKKAAKLGKSNQTSLLSAYQHCQKLHKTKYKDIKSYHMQECIDACGHGYSTQGAIKNLFRHLDRFALELDLVNRCYSELLTSESIPETEKIPFTDEEINRLWQVSGEPWIDSVLIFLYTGFRISELLDLRTGNVDLAAGTINGGTKTKAGKDRIIPIHSKIAPLVAMRAGQGEEYLFTYNEKKVNITKYYILWREIMERMGMKHTPHECRHTFRSRLDSAGANKKCIDLLMGHKSKDVGERVYTHKTIEELKAAVELLVY